MKAPALRPGDIVGIASPSFQGAALFPHRVERGMAQLEELGFRTRLATHALGSEGWVSGTPEERVADLHELFADPEVRAIVAAIGGDHSCQLLPLLDFDLIRANPTIFCGYSDNTVLNVALYVETGLVTFNGPCLLTDFAEFPQMYDYTRDGFLRCVSEPRPAGPVEPSDFWTEEFLNWGEKLDLTRPRERTPSGGWSWLCEGEAEGRLIGGCLESLEHLRGTRFWPDFSGAILFLEPSENAPSPSSVDAILSDYRNLGVFDELAGLLFGRPMRYASGDLDPLREVLVSHATPYGFPVIADMDFGHTAPQFTLPIGCRARISTSQRSFEIVEPAVE